MMDSACLCIVCLLQMSVFIKVIEENDIVPLF